MRRDWILYSVADNLFLADCPSLRIHSVSVSGQNLEDVISDIGLANRNRIEELKRTGATIPDDVRYQASINPGIYEPIREMIKAKSIRPEAVIFTVED